MENINKREIIKILFFNKFLIPGFLVIFITARYMIATFNYVDFNELDFSQNNIEVVNGLILSIQKAPENLKKSLIYKYKFEYKYDKERFESSSYGKINDINVGDSVRVEVLKSSPNLARIIDTTTYLISLDSYVLLSFPLMFGIVLLLIPLYMRYKLLVLLQGEWNIIKTVKFEEHLISSNFIVIKVAGMLQKGKIYQYDYKYYVEGKEFIKTIFKNIFRMNYYTEVSILYSVGQPDKAYILDYLPKMIQNIVVKRSLVNIKYT